MPVGVADERDRERHAGDDGQRRSQPTGAPRGSQGRPGQHQAETRRPCGRTVQDTHVGSPVNEGKTRTLNRGLDEGQIPCLST